MIDRLIINTGCLFKYRVITETQIHRYDKHYLSQPWSRRLFLTHKTIFYVVKIGKSIGVYSANTRNKYEVYRVYGVFGDLLCAAGRIPAV